MPKVKTSMKPERVRLTLKYEGPDVRAGEMDVHQLAPAMQGLGLLLNEAHRTLYGADNRVRTVVSANFRRGSFEVDLLLELTNQTRALFENLDSSDVEKLKTLGHFLLGSGGVIGLIKWLKGRKATSVVKDGNRLSITNINGDVQNFNGPVYNFGADAKNSRLIHDIIKPIESPGIRALSLSQDGEKINEVDGDDASAFRENQLPIATSEDAVLNRFATQRIVQAASIHFDRGRNWRLRDGVRTIVAKVLDQEFVDRVQLNQESFRKDDWYEVELLETQTLTNAGKVRNHFEVLKVLRHIPADRQEELFLPR